MFKLREKYSWRSSFLSKVRFWVSAKQKYSRNDFCGTSILVKHLPVDASWIWLYAFKLSYDLQRHQKMTCQTSKMVIAANVRKLFCSVLNSNIKVYIKVLVLKE